MCPLLALGSQEVGMVVLKATSAMQWGTRPPFPSLEAGPGEATGPTSVDPGCSSLLPCPANLQRPLPPGFSVITSPSWL